MGTKLLAEQASRLWRDYLPQIDAPKDASLEFWRTAIEARYPEPPVDVELDITVLGDGEALRVRAPGVREDRAALLVHGGGGVAGSARAHAEFAARLSSAIGATVWVVDYRLAPEAPFPTGLEDSISAYRELARRLGSANVVVVGSSAGGGMALALAMQVRDAKSSPPAAVVLISPLNDLTATGASYVSNLHRDTIITRELVIGMGEVYLAGADPRDPRASPLFGNFERLPPIQILVGGRELMLDDSVRVAHGIRETGGFVELEIVADAQHNFPLSAASQGTAVIGMNLLADFFRRIWSS